MVQDLIEGFYEFRKKEYEHDEASMPGLVKDGQSPAYFIVSCIDSRSDPGTIFCAQPGTFFAHKAMGAIIRPYKKGTALAAALQFSLVHSEVKKIIILGHTGCGAIDALVKALKDDEIMSFVEVAQNGLNAAKDMCGPSCTDKDLSRAAEEQILLQSLQNIKTYPSVTQALKQRRITLHAWLFEMKSGNLLEFSESSKKFEPITLTSKEIKERKHA